MALFEKLRSAFKGGAQERVPLSGNPFGRRAPLFATGSERPAYHYERAVREAFLGNPIAQRAVRIVAESVGQAPIQARNARMLQLVTATSAGQSLIETLAAHLMLHGNAYVQIMKDARGQPVELYALRLHGVGTGVEANACLHEALGQSRDGLVGRNRMKGP